MGQLNKNAGDRRDPLKPKMQNLQRKTASNIGLQGNKLMLKFNMPEKMCGQMFIFDPSYVVYHALTYRCQEEPWRRRDQLGRWRPSTRTKPSSSLAPQGSWA